MNSMEKNTDPDTGSEETLIDEIIRMSEYSFERMPMLEIIGERVAGTLSETLSEISGVPTDTTFSKLDYIAMWQALEAVPDPGFFVVCEDCILDGTFLMTMDVPMVLTTMELMLGGSPPWDLSKNKQRPTAIEKRFSTRIAKTILAELQAGFGLAVAVDFKMVGTGATSEAVAVTQLANLCVRMQFSLVQAEQVGNFQILIPYAMLDPVRSRLSKVYFGERKNEVNDTWYQSLTEQIERANVEIEAEFTRFTVPLRDVHEWKPGHVINLWVDKNHEGTINFNGRQIFNAALGKKKTGNVAVKITRKLETELDDADD